MKKIGTLNSDLSRVIAGMGHTDTLIICDSGLPIPEGRRVVDLALTTNIPRLMDTLEVVLEELEIERAIVAKEMKEESAGLFQQVCDALDSIEMQSMSHEAFKDLGTSDGNVTFVRTGEATPYANVALISGVTFG